MTEEKIREVLLRVLNEIAPECDSATIAPAANLRDQLDLDSMDFQSFVIRLHEELKLEIPERDYPKFATLDSAAEYLMRQLRR